jgi:RhtB (resistance to homoserine/threonine) family protein
VDTPFLTEFATVAVLHFAAAASPGPDFAIVLHQSIHHGRRLAIFTSFGIAAGILFHITYALFGLGWLLARYPQALEIMRYIGAAYLAWLGTRALRGCVAAKRPEAAQLPVPENMNTPTAVAAFARGLCVNVLNPKVVLYFVFMFTAVVAPMAPLGHKAIYSVWMVVATAAWFTCVSCFFTVEKIRAAFLRRVRWFDGIIGVFLLLLAGSLLVRYSVFEQH